MKKVIAIALVILTLAALLCACGDKGTGQVKTTVESKYDDGYAQSYASGTSTDENGNKVYEFTEEKYEEYVDAHKNTIAKDIVKEFVEKHGAEYGQFIYINVEKQAVMIGISRDEYDDATAQEEAAMAAEYGFNYFQNLEQPVDTIKVIYCNAGNQDEEYGVFTFTAE